MTKALPILRRAVPAALAIWLSIGCAAVAANKTISWSDELCENRVAFDPGKIDERQLSNVVHLLFGPSDFEAPDVSMPFTLDAVSKLDLQGTIQQCQNALDVAARLEFVPLKGIEEYRQARIAALKDTCGYETARIRGFREPASLREYKPAAACSGFVDALEGKKDLIATFRQTVEQSCKRNLSPIQCTEGELANASKPDGAAWVRLYLTTFGWQNCAVKYNYRNVEADRLARMRAGVEREFRRAFKVVQSKCDPAPDSHPELGETATFETDVAPGTLASQWNILAVGLFCGSKPLLPGRIGAYLYGISDARLRTGQPITARFDLDGKIVELAFGAHDELAVAPVEAEFVRSLLKARSASVQIKDYNFHGAERIKLDDADRQIRSALRKCYKH